MTQEELLQENEKLNKRLEKAIEVFKEQKENIARLTEERDKAKNDLKDSEVRVEELTTKLNEKSENDEKFFEQLNEIQVLEKRVQKLKSDCEQSYEDLGKANEKIKSLEADKSNLNDSLNYSEIKKNELQEANNNLTKQLNEAGHEFDGLYADYVAEQEKVEKLKEDLQLLREGYKNLEDGYKEIESKFEEQKETIENLTTALDKVNTELQEERKNTKLALTSISELTENKTRELLSSIKELCRTNCPI